MSQQDSEEGAPPANPQWGVVGLSIVLRIVSSLAWPMVVLLLGLFSAPEIARALAGRSTDVGVDVAVDTGVDALIYVSAFLAAFGVLVSVNNGRLRARIREMKRAQPSAIPLGQPGQTAPHSDDARPVEGEDARTRPGSSDPPT